MASSVLNSDDGVISGTSGLKSSGGDDGVLVFQSKGTETARINTDSQIVAAAGTASLPALTTTGDVNTGIFFPAADTIAFAEGGAEAMRIDSDGNVGIGTTSPSSFFSEARNLVVGTGTGGQGMTIYAGTGSQSRLFFADGTTGTDAYTGFVQYDHSSNVLTLGTNGGAERMRITSAGYFKQADNGTYNDSTGTYSEFNNTANSPACNFYPRNASQTANNVEILPTRSATSAYSFLVTASGAGTDVEHILRGDGNAYADGTWNNNGADYAEFFESANGQALTLGATVVLDGNKVREATEQDPASAVIGVVRPKEPSKASMMIGNTAWNKWANKYLTDDFDRYIMEDHDVVEWTDEEGKFHSYESQAIPEDVTVPANATRKTHDEKGNKFQHYKLNPAWNPDSEYVNRENRPEWNIIGLLGQVKILKGQPVGDRWVKMRDVSDTVEEWFIR